MDDGSTGVYDAIYATPAYEAACAEYEASSAAA